MIAGVSPASLAELGLVSTQSSPVVRQDLGARQPGQGVTRLVPVEHRVERLPSTLLGFAFSTDPLRFLSQSEVDESPSEREQYADARSHYTNSISHLDTLESRYRLLHRDDLVLASVFSNAFV